MSESAHVRLVCGTVVGVWTLMLALCSAYFARKSGKNPVLWFAIALVPIVGFFAVLFFLLPAVDSLRPDTRSMPFAQRRMAFALICYLIGFTLITGPLTMPTWLRAVLYLGGALIIFRFLGPRPQQKDDKPNV